MSLQGRAVIRLEGGESDVGKSRPHKRDNIETGPTLPVAKQLTDQTLGAIPAGCPSQSASGDDPQSARVEAVG